MEHTAIDLGARKSQICRRAADGTILEERPIPTKEVAKYFGTLSPGRVILETSAEAFTIADQALEAGHEVRVVPSILSRSLGVGQRGLKTDQRDARNLSEVSCRIDLPSVHVPSQKSRALKQLCTSREVLVAARTRLVNRVRGYLRTQVASMRACPSALATALRKRATDGGEPVPPDIEAVLQVIDAMYKQVRELDKMLSVLGRELEPCRRMMTVPGVGPVTAVRFFAAIDDRERFTSASGVQSYLGLTPGESSSGERSKRTGITKAGAAPVRRALVQAAWAMWRMRPEDPVVKWAQKIAERRGRQVAIVALARKLAGILYAIWRDGTPYNPMHELDVQRRRQTDASGVVAAAVHGVATETTASV